MRDLECRGASFPFSFQRRGFWLGNFMAASGRREQLAKLVPPGGTGATPDPLPVRLFFQPRKSIPWVGPWGHLQLATKTRASSTTEYIPYPRISSQ